MATTESLSTVLRNVSEKTKVFGCFKRSYRLAPGQELTIPGDVFASLQGDVRKIKVLQDLLTEGVLAIVKSPNVHLYDEGLDITKVLKLNNGTLATEDPSWGAYSSSIG
jgi:hypothetical protein